jgi:hypothetical protein
MHHRLVHHLRGNLVAYLALMLAVGGSGGYAIAATTSSSGKTITACANNKTGALLLHKNASKRCATGQHKVTWNAKGPAGATGATGLPGAPATDVWANVQSGGGGQDGQGLTVTNTAPGTYQATITAAGCKPTFNAATVSPVTNGDPPAGSTPGSFPVAWIAVSGTNGQQFTVYTGVSSGGTFTAINEEFNVIVACLPAAG